MDATQFEYMLMRTIKKWCVAAMLWVCKAAFWYAVSTTIWMFVVIQPQDKALINDMGWGNLWIGGALFLLATVGAGITIVRLCKWLVDKRSCAWEEIRSYFQLKEIYLLVTCTHKVDHLEDDCGKLVCSRCNMYLDWKDSINE